MRPRRSPFDVDCLFSGFGLIDAFNVEQRQVQVIEGIEYTGQGGLIGQVALQGGDFELFSRWFSRVTAHPPQPVGPVAVQSALHTDAIGGRCCQV